MLTTTYSTPVSTSSPVPSKVRVAIGVVMCLVGNMLISVALNIMKHVHNTLVGTERMYIKSLTWWLGLGLLLIGEIGNFAAYGFAPASVVAPLGSSGIICNELIAVFYLKEQFRLRDAVGIVWAIAGATFIVYFANTKEHVFTASQIMVYLKHYSFMVFIIVEVVVFLLVVYLHHGRDKISVVTILLQVGLLGSLTVISAKAVSSMITLTLWGNSQLRYPLLYIMVIVLALSGVGQMRYLNQAMSLYDATVVIPVNFVLFTIFAMLGGIVFYQEFWNLTPLQICMSVLGVFLSFAGVYLISGGRDVETGGEESDGLLSDEHDSVAEVPLESMAAESPSKEVDSNTK